MHEKQQSTPTLTNSVWAAGQYDTNRGMKGKISKPVCLCVGQKQRFCGKLWSTSTFNDDQDTHTQAGTHPYELQVCESSDGVVGTVAGRARGLCRVERVSGRVTLTGHRRLVHCQHTHSWHSVLKHQLSVQLLVGSSY